MFAFKGEPRRKYGKVNFSARNRVKKLEDLTRPKLRVGDHY